MRPDKTRRLLHRLFVLGAFAKGIDGALEIVGGVLLFLVSPDRMYGIVRLLTQHELSEDPHDLVANYLLQTSRHLSTSAKLFGAAYLLSHGLIKLGLVAGLLLRRHWAYPAGILAFLLFLSYQIYRYTHTHSPGLLALSALDVFVIVLTWVEYRRLRASDAFT